MKFLLIASYPASILKFRGALLEAISSRGFDIHIAAPAFKSFPDDEEQLRQLGYTLHDIPMQRTGTNPLSDAKTLRALYQLIKKLKPDYVLAYTIKPVVYGMLAASQAKVPNRFALITGLGYAFQQVEETGQRSKMQKLIHSLYQKALSKADLVFFQNPDDLNLFNQLKIISPKVSTAVVNGSGVDVSEYQVVPLPTNKGIPTIRFLLIARLLGDKGIREYAEAASSIKDKYPQVKFDLVGWLDDNPDSINKSELDGWIDTGLLKYWGKLSDVKPVIAESSIYVLPSYREGTPRTVLEAMAMGRPIITTDVPGCRETVKDGYNGFLVEVKSVDSLVKAMEKFINNTDLIRIMGAASRTYVEDKFDVHTVNDFMLTEMGIIENA